jgi:hypothetical protein
MSQQVIVFPRGQLTSKDKERLTKAGFCAVEADDPKAVVMAVPGIPLVSADDLLLSAMWGLNSSEGSSPERSRMVSELYRRMKLREKERTPAA